MPAPDSIKKLVDHFAALNADARQPRFNETQTRREFIDPFFEALGWDVSNRAGYSETYKDVIHEDALAVEGRSRAPDYAFRVGGRRVFFVEAKKPSVNLSEELAPAFQLRRYAWTAKLPISILTDFEELAVYDCRIKPAPTDKPTTGRLMLLTYRDYLSHWDELYARFSKEAVLRGDFDAYAETSRGKKGAADVDDDFLATIEGWRKALALNLALRNPGLTERDLNYAVQMTIDRILFLRIAEERGIERADQLKDIAGEGEIYAGLVQLFRLADQRYNSGLFHFSAEKGRSTHADTLTPALKVDDRVLKEIIRGLYYPVCPYAWYVLPAEILGQVYEQFLGRVIRLTPGHQAKVEEKPEVRKAGGVYYTPGYIVDYIVQQTVGQLLEGRTPAEAARLKIVDPACGSGSFLLGAYQHLLNWHLNWYTSHDPQAHARGARPAMFETRQGWALTSGKKKEILLNTIHGVDIDPQAVEVTKLSLLLKVLEGDLPAAETQLGLGLERMLPDLGSNIQCGNSLIGPDYYANRQLGLDLADDAEQYRVNAFDWQRAFPQVFAAGGFDAVIGNPPYGASFIKPELDYVISHYPETKKFPDSYTLFIIKAISLLKKNGKLGFIVPNTFCDLESCQDFRKWLLSNYHLFQIYQTGWAFKDAVVDTLVFILNSQFTDRDDIISIVVNNDKYSRSIGSFINNPLCKIDYRNKSENLELIQKIRLFPILSQFVVAKAGVKLYEKGKGTPPQTDKTLREKPFTSTLCQFDGWLPLIRGEDITRYSIRTGREYVNYGAWLAAPRSRELFDSPKILMRRTDDKIKASIERNDSICVNSCHVIKLNAEGLKVLSYEYLIGLINSKLLQRVFELQNPQMVGKVFSEIKVIYVERLPIRTINFADPAEAALHSRMVGLVEQMLALHARRAAAHNPQELELLARQIETADRAIDALVYQLYGLSEAEIKIVEG